MCARDTRVRRTWLVGYWRNRSHCVGPKTFRHHQTGVEASGQFGTSAESPTLRHWYRPPANIFCYIKPYRRNVDKCAV